MQHVRDDAHGALLVFDGLTRNHHQGQVVRGLAYEAYEPLAEQELLDLCVQAEARWPVKAAIVHRLGTVPLGEASVVVATASAHRDVAYQANRWLIDTLKVSVPIFKRETYVGADGEAHRWVANAEASRRGQG